MKYTLHQTSKLSRCLTYLNKSSYKSRNTLGKQCIAMWLKSFFMRFWILMKLRFHWIFLKLLMGPALVTISWNQVCMYIWIDRRIQKDFQPIMYVQSLLRIISFDAPAFAIKKMKPVSVKLVFLIRKSSYCFNYIHSLRKALPRGSFFFCLSD